jgi:N-acetylglucosaminyldiphosphoundecaprenol N-acetyl-beta-D-mannosaminyltransferase
MRVDATSYQDATEQILGWACRSESRYACVAAVNNIMQACDDEGFRNATNRADLVTRMGCRSSGVSPAAGLRDTYGWIERGAVA